MLLKSEILALTVPFLAGLVLSPRAALADVPITLALNGTNNRVNMGVYTGPYQVHGAGVPYWLVCDAFPADFSVGRQRSLKVYTLSSTVAARGCRWWTGNRWPATVASQDDSWEAGDQWYAQVGASGPQEFATADGVLYPDATAWPAYRPVTDDYSDAIGQIFSPEASYGDGGNGSVRSALDSSVNIYTPVDLGSGGLVSTSQEFTGVGSPSTRVPDNSLPVPEGSIVTFLVFDLLALPVIVFLMRRRVRHGA
jgi:hypothetical protein